jgi:hypothetical protein
VLVVADRVVAAREDHPRDACLVRRLEDLVGAVDVGVQVLGEVVLDGDAREVDHDVDVLHRLGDRGRIAAVRAVTASQLDLVGIAAHGPKNAVDKVLKGARMHP